MGEFGQFHFDQHSVTRVPLLSFIYLHHLLPTALLPGDLIVGRGAWGQDNINDPRPRPRDALSTRLGAYAPPLPPPLLDVPSRRTSKASNPVLLKTCDPPSLVGRCRKCAPPWQSSFQHHEVRRGSLPRWALVRNHISAGYRVYCV